jgi:DNA-binding Lrp family transcriptional regulator
MTRSPGVTPIDGLDADLIATVADDPRIGATELAKSLSVARNTVQARQSRLEAAGVLSGYTARVDLASIGFAVEAFVDLELAQDSLQQVIAGLAELPNVLEAHATTGRGDLLVRVAARTHEELQLRLQEILALPGVTRTTTHIALTTPIHYRITPLLRALTEEKGRGRSGVPRSQSGQPQTS